MKVLKFRKTSAGAADADEAYYVPAEKIEHIATAADEVVVHLIGKGANVSALDTITIVPTNTGDELALADVIANAIFGNMQLGGVVEISPNFDSRINSVTYTAV
tara:strand:- start:89 stop:400 length:312 start_codon:yes stop_codon:yes gene_type:complete